jgi:hypothetical protein
MISTHQDAIPRYEKASFSRPGWTSRVIELIDYCGKLMGCGNGAVLEEAACHGDP